MRTTLTLDEDVATELRKLCAERHQKFKTAVNEALRVGLAVLTQPPPASKRPYRIKPVSLGRPRLPNLDSIAEVLGLAEGDAHR